MNAPDLRMNSERAVMPSLVPRISGRAMSLDASFRISRCWANLGHDGSKLIVNTIVHWNE